MDPVTSIGKVLNGNEERDAIHIAILPVIAGDDYMYAAEEVGFVYGSNSIVKSKPSVYGLATVGIIDPFLKDSVKKGDRVWMFMLPGTITGLRHNWAHPAVDTVQAASGESEAWLRKFADSWNFDYDEMIAIASKGTVKKNLQVGSLGSIEIDTEWITARGVDLHSRSELGEDYALFWQHMEALTGQKFDEAHREKVGWSCSC